MRSGIKIVLLGKKHTYLADPNTAAGRRNVYTIYRLAHNGRTKPLLIGRELPFAYAKTYAQNLEDGLRVLNPSTKLWLRFRELINEYPPDGKLIKVFFESKGFHLHVKGAKNVYYNFTYRAYDELKRVLKGT